MSISTATHPFRDPGDWGPQLACSVALVTGGGRGIGRMVAAALAGAGAAVGLIARSGAELTQAVELIETAGGTAEAAIADVQTRPRSGMQWPACRTRSARSICS